MPQVFTPIGTFEGLRWNFYMNSQVFMLRDFCAMGAGLLRNGLDLSLAPWLLTLTAPNLSHFCRTCHLIEPVQRPLIPFLSVFNSEETLFRICEIVVCIAM